MFTFTDEKNNGLLHYELEPGERVDEFTINMLKEAGPAHVNVVGREEGGLLLPVSHCVLASEAVRTGEPVAPIIHSLMEAIREARRCMIPVAELLLDIRFLYINKVTREVTLLCLPTDRAAQYSQEPRELFRSLAASAVYPGTLNRNETWDLLCYINSDEYSLEGLVEYLNRPKDEKKEPEPEQSRRGKLQAFLAGDTQELPEIQAYGGPDDAYSVVLRSTGQEFGLGKHAAVIGSDPARADICLRCNAFVDAEHAKITWERGSYYVEDLHSHTGIRRNSRKVRVWRPERLEPGDVLKIGEDELVFSCRNMPK